MIAPVCVRAAVCCICRRPMSGLLEKAKTLPADGLIFDLEDAVAPDAKAAARDAAVNAVKSGSSGPREVLIRVNALDTAWSADDLKAAAASGAHGIVLPKVNSAARRAQS